MAALLPDLDTKSVLHVVEENYEREKLKTVAIRMVYAGEHRLPKEDIIQHFEQTVHDVNGSYCEINVHGLLLVYDSYFVHIIEGSEDTVHRHLRFLFARELHWIERLKKQDEAAIAGDELAGIQLLEEPKEAVERKMFRRLKLLTVYHSISTRLFGAWRAVTARPPHLVGRLAVFGSLAEHAAQLRICLDKIRKLCTLSQEDEGLSFAGLSANDPKMETLPEVTLLDFLLQSQHILDLRQVVHLHRRVDDYAFYFEHVWPLPTHFTPRLLYKLKVDDSFVEPLPVMPWELAKKEETEDEDREERQSGSSSSN